MEIFGYTLTLERLALIVIVIFIVKHYLDMMSEDKKEKELLVSLNDTLKNRIDKSMVTPTRNLYLFYRPTCSACKNFKPTWAKFRTIVEKSSAKDYFKIIEIDTSSKDYESMKSTTLKNLDISSVPTVIITSQDSEVVPIVLFDAEQTCDELVKFVNVSYSVV